MLRTGDGRGQFSRERCLSLRGGAATPASAAAALLGAQSGSDRGTESPCVTAGGRHGAQLTLCPGRLCPGVPANSVPVLRRGGRGLTRADGEMLAVFRAVRIPVPGVEPCPWELSSGARSGASGAETGAAVVRLGCVVSGIRTTLGLGSGIRWTRFGSVRPEVTEQLSDL